jgi:hypothetical protein
MTLVEFVNTKTDNPLSISHIQGAAGANCVVRGIDGSETYTYGVGTVDVGPPQTQISIACWPSGD